MANVKEFEIEAIISDWWWHNDKSAKLRLTIGSIVTSPYEGIEFHQALKFDHTRNIKTWQISIFGTEAVSLKYLDRILEEITEAEGLITREIYRDIENDTDWCSISYQQFK